MNADESLVGVYFFNEILIGRNENVFPIGCAYFKQDVHGIVINANDGTNDMLAIRIHETESNDLVPSNDFWFIICEAIWKINIAIGEFTSLFLCIYITEFHQCTIFSTKTILFHEKRNENTVNIQNEVSCFHTVEHIIIEKEMQFSLDSVRLSYASNFIYFFLGNHKATMDVDGNRVNC